MFKWRFKPKEEILCFQVPQIDYPDVQIMKNSRSGQCNNVNINRMFDLEHEDQKLRKMHCDTAVEQLPPDYKNEMLYHGVKCK